MTNLKKVYSIINNGNDQYFSPDETKSRVFFIKSQYLLIKLPSINMFNIGRLAYRLTNNNNRRINDKVKQ